jgi:hypothetical protein
MEVFVLMGSFPGRERYEGDYLLGVYVSEQEAVDALGVYMRQVTTHHGYYIDRRVLGAPAENDFNDEHLRRYL